MRQLLNLRLWLALGVLALGALFVLLISCDDCFGRGSNSAEISADVEKNIETVAIATTFIRSEGWRIENGRTIGEASVSLDDAREIFIAADTPGENLCGDLSVGSSCVFLANMFGDSVMWFAFVDTNSPKPTRVLELPSLVDMLDSGSRGVLANDWIVPLANGVKRTCGEDTGTLREFINNYSPDNSVTKLNLITDQVDEVVCTG
ncbi:MAG: hypothetical protein CK542_02975 [Acidimicrobium sp.]|nr:MAG: hypothetical protein CK542_02975 [Acidimicrobium sp.]